MQLDAERYRHHIDFYNLGEAERLCLTEQIWRIAVSAIDRTTGDAPEQILLGIAGTKCPARAHDRLDSIDTLTPTFNDAANNDATRKPTL